MILEAYRNFIGSTGTVFFVKQTLTILALFLAGFLPLSMLRDRMEEGWKWLLSYPLGVSEYGVLGSLLLITGVKLTLLNIIIAYILVLAGVILWKKRTDHQASVVNITFWGRVILSVAVILTALVATSGVLPQIITNDSVYYYSVYPSILSSEGYLSLSLDKFLTDVGQTTAVVQSLPFFAGFDETFGIQHFMGINFICIFFAAVYEDLKEYFPEKTYYAAGAVICTLFLLTSESFVVMSTWILSNAYFMELFFIAFYIAFKMGRDGSISGDFGFTLLFLIAMLSMCRMEGGVMVLVLALSLSGPGCSFDKRRMMLYFALPLTVMVIGYYVNLYLRIGVDPLYSFLDIKTALLMVALILGFSVYILFIRDRLPSGYIPSLLILLLILGNAGLLIINPERYITNIKAFTSNIRAGNGWGMFWVVLAVYIVYFAYELIKRRFRDIPVTVYLPAAVTLAVFAVCFARGGVLAVRTSDSGNRVLMEFVPLIVFCVSDRLGGYLRGASGDGSF